MQHVQTAPLQWPEIDRDAALQHLAAVGYMPSETVVIAIYPPELGQRCYHRVYDVDDIDWRELESLIRDRPHYSIGFVVNPGGTKISHIRECRAHFFEFDNIPPEQQLEAWRTFDLPHPTLQVETGGKSVHQYFRLVQGDDPTQWRKRQERLLHDLLAGESDNSLVKPNQVLRLAGTWHPKTRRMARIVSMTGEMFTTGQIEACLPAVQEPEKVVPLAPRTHDPDATRERYLSALEHVPPRGKAGDGGYPNAFRVLCALVKEFGPADAEAIAERWSPSDPRNGWSIPAKIRSIIEMGSIRSDGGTIIGIARENGWQDPWQRRMVQALPDRPRAASVPPSGPDEDLNDDDDDDGDVERPSTVLLSSLTKNSDFLPLVLRYVFKWPETPWVCVEDKLYRWCGTHYELVEDSQAAPAIAEFLEQLAVVPSSGVGEVTHPFARPRYVRESLEWFRQKLGEAEANPANAINCRNGVVSWSWDGDDLLVSFDAHSPARVFTYVTGYDYKPDIDREPMSQLLAALNDDQRTTIQRALGSSLDLAKYRARRGRPRALLMLGGGSNGKDTIRGVMQAALGDRKATICSMSDFRQYDQGRKFPLAPLRDSSLNWPSENTEFVSVDDLQSVKSAISGDPLSWEVKGCQEESFIPSCLLVFNCNKPPLLSGADEAVRTRWYVCEFGKTFTSSPTKPDELQADPRFKDDPDFITRELAPAFLLWLLEGLQAAVKHGIDYSSGGVAMTKVRALSCHLWGFAEDYNLIADPDGSIYVSALYDALKHWYTTEGVIDGNGRWVEGVLPDKPVKAAHNLVERLRSVFPGVKTSKEPVTKRSVIHGVKQA
jgi:putative DNA primase/helicase